MNFLNSAMQYLDFLLGWPLLLYVITIAVLCTVFLYGVQFRYFTAACRALFIADSKTHKKEGDLSPLAAFLNTLSTNMGNGSIVGVATALYAGGPGAALWIAIFGILLMSVRFAEVYLSLWSSTHNNPVHGLGGPMIYLRSVVCGRFLAGLYAIFTFIFGFIGGNIVQVNSIHQSITRTWGLNPYLIAGTIGVCVFYIILGGSARIVKVVDFLMPIRLAIFFIATGSVFVYFWADLGAALHTIVTGAWNPTALSGGALGFTLAQVLRNGLAQSVFATESGLGTAGILYGGSYGSDVTKQALVSMMSTFVSICICFTVALCFVVSGAWNQGGNGAAMAVDAFSTVFGVYGGWIMSFLSISFGIGVLVPYAYITRSVWFYMTNRRYEFVFIILYGTCSIVGSLAGVSAVWKAAEIVNGGMLFVNLFGILYLLPIIRAGLAKSMNRSA